MAATSPLGARRTVAALLILTTVTGLVDRRLGSVAAMLAGAAAGAGILRWSPTAVITIAALLVATVAGAFMTTLVPTRSSASDEP